MPCQALPNYVLTDHARLEMQRRGITEADVAAVLTTPGKMCLVMIQNVDAPLTLDNKT